MNARLKTFDLFSGYVLREDGAITSRFGKAVKQQLSKNGYVRVELWSNGKGKKYLLHRLLAEAFIPNQEDKPLINHIDGNKSNNILSNLEWATRSENQLHAYREGLQVGYKKSSPLTDGHKKALCGSRWKYESHLYILDNLQFRNLHSASQHFGVSRQTILNRCRSVAWPLWSKTVERDPCKN